MLADIQTGLLRRGSWVRVPRFFQWLTVISQDCTMQFLYWPSSVPPIKVSDQQCGGMILFRASSRGSLPKISPRETDVRYTHGRAVGH